MKNIGVILSGGNSTRFGGEVPKQYCELNGKEVIRYTIEAFEQSALLGDMVIVVDENEYRENRMKYEHMGRHIIKGGNTRNQSLFVALKYIEKRWKDCENVFIHEAARPFIKKEIIDEYLRRLAVVEGIFTAQHITDSLGKEGEHRVDRSEYYLIQAPEAFRFKLLLKNFSPESKITATVQHLPEGVRIERYYDFRDNMKITYPEDFYIAEQYMRMKNVK